MMIAWSCSPVRQLSSEVIGGWGQRANFGQTFGKARGRGGGTKYERGRRTSDPIQSLSLSLVWTSGRLDSGWDLALGSGMLGDTVTPTGSLRSLLY